MIRSFTAVCIALLMAVPVMPVFSLTEDSASLHISSDSLPAAIYIDGKMVTVMNSFDMSISISKGKHTITAVSPFKKEIEKSVDISEDMTLNLSFKDAFMTLTANDTYGCVINRTDFYVADANNPLRIFPGNYSIRCGTPGYYLSDEAELGDSLPAPHKKSKVVLKMTADRHFAAFIDNNFFGIFNGSGELKCSAESEKLRVEAPVMDPFMGSISDDESIRIKFTPMYSVLRLNCSEDVWFAVYEGGLFLGSGNGTHTLNMTSGNHILDIYSPDKLGKSLTVSLSGGSEKTVEFNLTASPLKRGYGRVRINVSSDISEFYNYALWLDNTIYACGNSSEVDGLPEGIYNIRLDIRVNDTLMKTLIYNNATIEANKTLILDAKLENASIVGNIRMIKDRVNASGEYMLFVDGKCMKFVDGCETSVSLLPGTHVFTVYGEYNGNLVSANMKVSAGVNFSLNMSLRDVRGKLRIKFNVSNFNAMLVLNDSVEFLGHVKHELLMDNLIPHNYSALLFASGKRRYYPVNMNFTIVGGKETLIEINMSRCGGDVEARIYEYGEIYGKYACAFFDDVCVWIGNNGTFMLYDVYPGKHRISVITPYHADAIHIFTVNPGETSHANISLLASHSLQILGITSKKRIYYISESFAEVHAFIYDERGYAVLKGINVVCSFMGKNYSMTADVDRWVCTLDISRLKSGNYTYTIYADGSGYEPTNASAVIKIRDPKRDFAIQIMEPGIYSEVKGVVKISLNVHSPPGMHVKKIEIYSNNSIIGKLTHEPYIYYWDTLKERNGIALLKAVLFGSSNRTEWDEIMLYINNTQVPIEINIISPKQGDVVKGRIDIEVNASGRNLTVELRIDGRKRDNATSPPYTFLWDTANESEGLHLIEAVAEDIYGNSRCAATYVIVERMGISLEVIILNPGMWEVVNGTCEISGYISPENVSISSVELYVDDILMNTTNESRFSFLLDTTKLKDGVHEIKVRAHASDGAVFESPLKIKVKNGKDMENEYGIPPFLIVVIVVAVFGMMVAGYLLLYKKPAEPSADVKKDENVYTCPLCKSEFAVDDAIPVIVECPFCSGVIEVREDGAYEVVDEGKEVRTGTERT